MKKTILILFILSVVVSPFAHFSKLEAAERAHIECSKKGDTYFVKCTYTVAKKRLVIIAVIDRNNKPRRIYRRTVFGGTHTFEWKGKESRFGKLIRACVAVHETRGAKKTVASDCNGF